MRQGLLRFTVFAVVFMVFGLARLANAEVPSVNDAMADRILGDPNAPVTILDFSSLTCPHCAVFHTETLPKIKAAYIDTGKVKLVFRDFPLDRNSAYAAMLARCADPKRYYGFIDVLFKTQTSWGHADDPLKALAQIAMLGGMSRVDFDACMNNTALNDALLQRRLDYQNTYHVESTPTFVFNNGAAKLDGALPFEKFRETIDALLK